MQKQTLSLSFYLFLSLFLSFVIPPNAEFLLYQNAFHLKTKRINQKRAKNATRFASVQLECVCVFVFRYFIIIWVQQYEQKGNTSLKLVTSHKQRRTKPH